MGEPLDETMARRPEIRKRLVYIRRKAMGPPAPETTEAELVDEMIRESAIDFDLSPVLAGDKLLAQRVADDFVKDLRKRVSDDPDVSESDLEARLNRLWPYLYRSLNIFRDRLKAAIGGQST